MNEVIEKMSGIDSDKLSLSRALLIFYVIIASQFTGDLLGKQFKEFIKESRIAQHVIGFILLFVLINNLGGITNTEKALAYSLIGYLWFMLTTKLDIQWNLVIIMMLFAGYIYENKIIESEERMQNEFNIESHKKLKKYVILMVLITTLIGVYLYSNKKTVQYGGGYDLTTFLFY